MSNSKNLQPATGSLVGKRALVTGAGGTIGHAIVSRLVAAGARVMAADLDAESLTGLVTSHGNQPW